ncbi:MAG: PAS domain S-box protein [Candidatus Nanopelagicales bacterium]
MSERGLVHLVVDQLSTAAELREVLEDAHYTVRTVPGRPEDVLSAVADQPDLLVVDAYLDGVDAFDLVARLRDHSHVRDLPVVFVASEGDSDSRVRGLESADDLIVTPLDPREVLTRIERQVTVSKVRMALRESEAKFRSVMESAIDAIISADSEGVIRSWNSAAAALFGRTEAEMVGQPIELIIPDRFRGAHRAGVHRVTSGGPTHVIGQTVELSALRQDGSEFPVELSLATWFLDEDRYYTGIIRDISERKQAEQKFRSVTESAIDAIISADHVGEIVTWNSAATRILGYTEEEAVGQRLELVIPERYHQLHRDGMARFTATGEPHVIGTTVELSARTKDGEEIPIELSLSTWTVREARFYTGIIRDIGERKAAEEALRQSEQALREKSEELHRKNADLQGTLDKLSQMQDQLILQEKMASLGRLSAGMAHELNNPAAAAQRGAAQASHIFTQLQENQLRLGQLQLDSEERIRLAELDRMARERSREPAELSPVARADLEAEFEEWLQAHGVRAVGDLAPALVGLGFRPDEMVELGHPFDGAALGTVVEWMGLKFLIYSVFAEIAVGTNRIAELVKAMKTYTYMDQAPVQDVDVRDGLDNTLIILHNKLKRGVTVRREYDDDLPRIQAYASELNQVWTNLIDNAIDAMGGTGVLTVRARRHDDAVQVHIEDDGPGIPPDVASKVFDPFFTTKPPGEGTGLGLNISRNIVVKKHRGTMTVESEPGRTRFVVTLPVGSIADSVESDPVATEAGS